MYTYMYIYIYIYIYTHTYTRATRPPPGARRGAGDGPAGETGVEGLLFNL